MKILEKQKKPPKKEAFLKKSLLEAQRCLENAYTGLDGVNDPDLIDSYIYELNAAYLRYRVLLRDFKALTLDEEHQIPQINPTVHSPITDLETPSHHDSLHVSDIFEL